MQAAPTREELERENVIALLRDLGDRGRGAWGTIGHTVLGAGAQAASGLRGLGAVAQNLATPRAGPIGETVERAFTDAGGQVKATQEALRMPVDDDTQRMMADLSRYGKEGIAAVRKVPGVAPAYDAVADQAFNVSTKSPALAALALGGLNVLGPGGKAGAVERAAADAAEQAARASAGARPGTRPASPGAPRLPGPQEPVGTELDLGSGQTLEIPPEKAPRRGAKATTVPVKGEPPEAAIKAALRAAPAPVPVKAPLNDADFIEEAFTGKAAREAAQQRKAAEMAEKAAGEGAPKKGSRAIVSGENVGLSPRHYRELEQAGGPQAVYDALDANGGDAHLKQRADGTFVGAPRTFTSKDDIQSMRDSLDSQISTAVRAQQILDPEREVDWYNRAEGAHAAQFAPWQLARGLESNAAYSAGVAPKDEQNFAVKHDATRAIGAPEVAKFAPEAARLDASVAAGVPHKLGMKTGKYKDDVSPLVVNSGLGGTNDFRNMQSHGYTEPSGKPQHAGATATEHQFLDAESALKVRRANKKELAGRIDWTGPMTQEATWVLDKAQDLYNQRPKKYAGPDGKMRALQDANNTVADFFNVWSSTHEQAPGKVTGHRLDYFDMTPQEQAAFNKTGDWARPARSKFDDRPMSPADKDRFNIEGGVPAAVGAGDRDALFQSLALRTLPTIDSTGQFQGESNPLRMGRVMVPMEQPSYDEYRVDPETGKKKVRSVRKENPNTIGDNVSAALRAPEVLRGAVDAQHSVAGNFGDIRDNWRDPNGFLLDTRNKRSPTDPWTGRQPSPDELKEVEGLLPEGWGTTATNRGIQAFPFERDAAAAEHVKQMGKDEFMQEALRQAVPGSTYHPTILDDSNMFYKEVYEGTEPFQGQVASKVLQEFADAPPEVAHKVGESEDVRSIIREKMDRDEGHPNTRRDIQNLRHFFAEKDWPKVVDLIRKGMKPAAAAAALGYNLKSMAAEQEQK